MKKHVPLALLQSRVREGQMSSDDSYGMAGSFRLIGPGGVQLGVISSGPESNINETGWEHVSVVGRDRPPYWSEMCFVKNLFWSEHEMVVQYHPPKSEYVDCHPYCLHLWKPIHMTIPMPPSLLVGPKR